MDNATKPCTRCKITKPREDFNRRAAMADGLRSQCKACDAADRRAGRERDRPRQREWREANRVRVRQADRDRYHRDPARFRTRKQEWARANPETVRESRRKTQLKYPHASADRSRRWREANPDADHLWREANRELSRARIQRYRARKKELTIIPFTVEQLAARLSMFPGCWICGGPGTEVDHVKPLAKGGAHMLANLRKICRSDNARKSDRWPLPQLARST